MDGREEQSRSGSREEAEAAFQEHGEISEGVSEFERWLERSVDGDAAWAKDLHTQLVPLCNILKAHFASEESSSLYKRMPEKSAGFADAIERLFDEHYDMIREIESLIQSAHAIPGSTFEGDRRILTRRARGIIFALRRHEAEENEILHQMYWADLDDERNS